MFKCRISSPFYSNKLGSKLHQGCYNLLNMFLIAKCSIFKQGWFDSAPPFTSQSSLLLSPPRLEEGVEDISSGDKIRRLVKELVRELDKTGDTSYEIQIRSHSLNLELTNSLARRGYRNHSFISDEGNATGSETSSVMLTNMFSEHNFVTETGDEAEEVTRV